MSAEFPPIRGRGASDNPPNRFLPIAVERNEWTDPDDPAPQTRLLLDATRSILTRNQSPDVGFDVSVNPYRGCEHGCVYCLEGNTSILMADGSTRPLADLRVGDEVYGTARRGWYRRYVPTLIRAHWNTEKVAYRITLRDGTELVASGDHRFLTLRGWKFVIGEMNGHGRRPHLTRNDVLLGTGATATTEPPTGDYRLGYLTGMIRGDGLLASYRYERAGRQNGDQHQFRLALIDREALDRTAAYLSTFGVATHSFQFQKAEDGRRGMTGIRTHARDDVQRIRELTAWRRQPSVDWDRGFLSGIFDAEGSHDGKVLRISNSDPEILRETARAFRRLCLEVVLEPPRRTDGPRPVRTLRLRGGIQARLRFLHLVDPAIRRKCRLHGLALKSRTRLRVEEIEPLGRRELYDISTGTGDFIANGVVSHNCYARPTHEYMGLSAGLDFETQILVKESAPTLLRKELSSPRWRPQTIAMSGVTDPYQPAERRLRITRGCLEVLAEFRNPVAVITKNHLVTRDVDLLSELATHEAAAVSLSITTLDRHLQRIMEPRTAVPERRLDAIRKLAEAGIPVGVNVAPVIPGLTDHEMPAILEAAADAGATRAGWIMLRLPHGVKDLFETWLGQHFPDRKEKVLNRLRELRGGRLYDSTFGDRMRGHGPFARQVARMFEIACRRHGLNHEHRALSTAAFRRPAPGGQLGLFESP